MRSTYLLTEKLSLMESHRLRLPYKQAAVDAGRAVPDISLPEWASLFHWCFACGRSGVALQVHHIERRPHCYKPHQDWTENLFKACVECHQGPLATMPHRVQLAYKWVSDPSGWDSLDMFVARWLSIRDPARRAPFRVTANEVETAAMEFVDEYTTLPGISRILKEKLLTMNSLGLE